MKKEYEAKLNVLRRKNVMTTKYDEFISKKTISKLKKDLKSTKDNLKVNQTEVNKLKNIPNGIDMIQDSIRKINFLEQYNSELLEQIETLNFKLNANGSLSMLHQQDKRKFYEGAVWISTYKAINAF